MPKWAIVATRFLRQYFEVIVVLLVGIGLALCQWCPELLPVDMVAR